MSLYATHKWMLLFPLFSLITIFSCNDTSSKKEEATQSMKHEVTAAEMLGNPDYPAICYGGYREKTRDIQPTVDQLKEDMLLLSAMGIKIVRTYHTELPHASNVLRAIRQLKVEDPEFEMYVIAGCLDRL